MKEYVKIKTFHISNDKNIDEEVNDFLSLIYFIDMKIYDDRYVVIYKE